MATTVVIQLQRDTVKVGISGESVPRFVYNRAPSDPKNSDGKNYKQIYYIDLFQNAFTKKLCVKAKDARILVVEDVFEVKADRDAIFSALLVDIGVAELSVQPGLFMSILTSTITSGLIIDIGEEETKVLAVFQGRPLLQTLSIAQVGAVDVANSFSEQVQRVTERAVPLDYTEAMKVLREHTARALMQSEPINAGNLSENPAAGLSSVLVPLPAPRLEQTADSRPSPPVQVLLPALIFHSSLRALVVGTERAQIAEAVLDCLKACNSDVRATVLANVIVCGCLADIPGLPESLCEETSSALSTASSDTSSGAKYAAVAQTVRKALGSGRGLQPAWTGFEREHLAWIGGSLFAAQKDNQTKFISAAAVMQRQQVAGVVASPDWMSVDPKDWTFYGRTAISDTS